MAFWPRGVAAAEAARNFYIPPQQIPSALIAFALQSDISVGHAPNLDCGPRTVDLAGRYTVKDGLKAILRKTACTFIMPDPRTAVIIAVAPPAPIKPVKPASQPAVAAAAPEVVVTASRRAELIDRSPYDVTRIGEQDLVSAGVSDIGGLATLVSGMTVTNLGPGRDKILLRGLSDGVFTGRTQSTVGLYLDDVTLTYNAPDPDLRLVDIASVEVLRGPQGALYGAGSIGGVVHIITQKPDLTQYSGSVTVAGAETAVGAGTNVIEGVANLPILTDRLGLRIVGYREADGGYIDDVLLKRDNANSTDRDGVRAQALLKVTEDWKATLSGVYQSLNSADTQYVSGDLGSYRRATQVLEPHDNDFDEVSLVIEGRGPGWRFKSSTSEVHHQITSQYDASDSLAFFQPNASGAATFTEADHKSLMTQEFTLASDAVGKTQWLIGLFALRDRENTLSQLKDYSTQAPTPGPLYIENRTDRIGDYAAYGEITFTPWSEVFLTLGGRLFQTTGVTGSAVSTPPGVRLVMAKTDDQGFAPKIVARYQFSPSVMAYLQITEGYRGSGVNTSGLPAQAFAASSNQPFMKFAGDQLWNYEIGAKLSLYHSTVSIRTALFYDSWDNIQTDQILPSGLPFTANVGDGANKGVEIEALYQPTPEFWIRGDAAFNDPELVSPAAGFSSVADASLPGISRATAGIQVSYRRPVTQTVTAFLDARAAYVGESTIGFDAATMASMGNYTTGRIALGADTTSFRAQIFIENPANTVGNTFAYGDPFSIRQTKQTTPLRPRTIGVSLSASF